MVTVNLASDENRKLLSKEKQIEALSKISGAITSDLYLEEILKLIVAVTAQVMDSKICTLMLLNGESQELEIRATQSFSEEYRRKPNVRLDEGIAGIVARENKPMTVEDVTKEEEYKYRDIAEKEGLNSLLCVPMSVKGEVIGVLNSYTSSEHEFTKSEIDMLTAVANQAAIVIENAELVVKVKGNSRGTGNKKVS